MRLLATGGLGFIGSNFVRHTLSTTDIDVVNLDNLSYGSNVANLAGFKGSRRYRFVKGDLTNQELMEQLLKDVDIVVNFAAESHVDRSISDSRPFIRSNVVGVNSLLEAIRRTRKRIRLVHIGTDEEYGDISAGSSKEDAVLRPSSPYSASKAAASLLVGAYHRTYGLETVVARCTNNFGPFQSPEKFIPKTIIKLLTDQKVPIYGSGENIRDWLYVADFCSAIHLLIKKGESGTIYNVAGKNEISNNEIVARILAILGRRKADNLVTHVTNRPGHDLRYSLDDRRIRLELGWRPEHRFTAAMKSTVRWYQKNDSWWRPFIRRRLLSSAPWKLRW